MIMFHQIEQQARVLEIINRLGDLGEDKLAIYRDILRMVHYELRERLATNDPALIMLRTYMFESPGQPFSDFTKYNKDTRSSSTTSPTLPRTSYVLHSVYDQDPSKGHTTARKRTFSLRRMFPGTSTSDIPFALNHEKPSVHQVPPKPGARATRMSARSIFERS